MTSTQYPLPTSSPSAPITSHRQLLSGDPSTPSDVSIHYLHSTPVSSPSIANKGTLLLIHGFPETSHQFRHVIPPFTNAGYTVIAPDYRGAGQSSHPRDGFDKVTMATDLHTLLQKYLGITEKVHVVGHDIGGMVAHAYAATFSSDTASVSWGECPLPGTKPYDRYCATNPAVWHFHFHWQTDLPELLTYGREREYIRHFYSRLGYNMTAITEDDIDFYARQFSQAGGMRCGFDVYRGFHKDAEDNQAMLKRDGKCKVPCLMLNGKEGFLAPIAEEQGAEMYENMEAAYVEGSGHWCAEENPQGFADAVIAFAGKHGSK